MTTLMATMKNIIKGVIQCIISQPIVRSLLGSISNLSMQRETMSKHDQINTILCGANIISPGFGSVRLG